MTLDWQQWLLLSLVLGTGVFVEAVAGFGGTIVALSIGAQWFSIEQLLAWFLPLNMLLSVILAIRGRTAIEGRTLGIRILPMILLGLALGTAAAWVLDAERAKLIFAGLVIVIAVAELGAHFLGVERKPLSAPIQLGLLFGAGTVHGLFGTGGPLAVAAISRIITTKSALRATLAVMWLVLNLLVLARLLVKGPLSASTLVDSALLLPGLLVGLAIGEIVHQRVAERHFLVAVAGVLLVTGALLVVAVFR